MGLQTKTALAAQREVESAAVADDARDLTAELLFEGGGPWHETKAQSVVDHGEAAGGERETLADDAGHLLAGLVGR